MLKAFWSEGNNRSHKDNSSLIEAASRSTDNIQEVCCKTGSRFVGIPKVSCKTGSGQGARSAIMGSALSNKNQTTVRVVRVEETTLQVACL